MSNTLPDNIEAVEAGYEYLLAYAAQGRSSDRTKEADGNSEVRNTLIAMSAAAKNITSVLGVDTSGFSAVVVEDARKTDTAITLVLAQDEISSELVDNLNASIHLRALLTDLFLLSETLPRTMHE